MLKIKEIKTTSLYIFLIPVLSVNLCLILSQIFPYGEGPFAIGDAINDPSRSWIIPYIDGGASISRVVRVFPNNLIFKPAMFITSILLIYYWLSLKKTLINLNLTEASIKKMIFFGIFSAICLTLHSIFLGTEVELKIYKFLRRLVLLSFIIFEIIAQTLLVIIFFKNENKLFNLINIKILKLKKILVMLLIFFAIIILPFLPFNNLKILKYTMEWNYFIGVNSFYLLSFFMWKKLNYNPTTT